ncbi:MAG TPA: hypothetical protein VK439_09090 [Rubrivivax sp.]|nr:hypothetical protein [Rubrivivax sp.]
MLAVLRTAACRALVGSSLVACGSCLAEGLADLQSVWQPDAQQRVALSLKSQVVHQPLTWQPRGGNPELHTNPSTQSSLGLEFRRKSSSQSAKDLLKVQLTADSALNFRPRGGGMVVTYRSQF